LQQGAITQGGYGESLLAQKGASTAASIGGGSAVVVLW
jgi:hypothetical protein